MTIKNKKINKTWLVALILLVPIFIILELVLSFTPLISGIASYPLKTIQCGNPPYIASDFAASFSYTKPGDGNYRGPTIFTNPEDFFCSESEVRNAGYSPDIWGDTYCKESQGRQESQCKVGRDGYDIVTYIVGWMLLVSAGLSYLVSVLIVRYGSKQTNKSKKK